MDKEIIKGELKSFSNEDIMRLCEGKVNIYTYPKLAGMVSIDQLLNYPIRCGAAIILYMTKKNYGHWVAIFETKPGLEFFDSYGISPDDELKLINEEFREQSNQDRRYLSRLMLESGKQVIYNNINLQSKKNDISTCGRWAGLRIALRTISLKNFQNLFINQTFPPDWYVSALTLFV